MYPMTSNTWLSKSRAKCLNGLYRSKLSAIAIEALVSGFETPNNQPTSSLASCELIVSCPALCRGRSFPRNPFTAPFTLRPSGSISDSSPSSDADGSVIGTPNTEGPLVSVPRERARESGLLGSERETACASATSSTATPILGLGGSTLYRSRDIGRSVDLLLFRLSA